MLVSDVVDVIVSPGLSDGKLPLRGVDGLMLGLNRDGAFPVACALNLNAHVLLASADQLGLAPVHVLEELGFAPYKVLVEVCNRVVGHILSSDALKSPLAFEVTKGIYNPS